MEPRVLDPWYSCPGHGPCLWQYLGGMNKGHKLQCACGSFLSFLVPVLVVSLESHLLISKLLARLTPVRKGRTLGRQGGVLEQRMRSCLALGLGGG